MFHVAELKRKLLVLSLASWSGPIESGDVAANCLTLCLQELVVQVVGQGGLHLGSC